jgi:hypothetical protein
MYLVQELNEQARRLVNRAFLPLGEVAGVGQKNHGHLANSAGAVIVFGSINEQDEQR